MKMRPIRAKLFYADRRTDMTKLIVVSRSFASATKKDCSYSNRWLAYSYSCGGRDIVLVQPGDVASWVVVAALHLC